MAYTSSNQNNIFVYCKYITNFVINNSKQTFENLISKRLDYIVSLASQLGGLKHITMKGKSDIKDDVMKFVSSFSIFGKDDQINDGANIVSSEKPASKKAKAEQPTPMPEPEKAIAYITPGQTINGSIISSDELVVEGIVNGDIESSANVTVRGTVNGNVIGSEIEICEATVNGNIQAKAKLWLYKCQVTGDISADSIEVNGNVNGSITATESCDILESAVIHGDVTSAILTVKKNALIKGKITMAEK